MIGELRGLGAGVARRWGEMRRGLKIHYRISNNHFFEAFLQRLNAFDANGENQERG